MKARYGPLMVAQAVEIIRGVWPPAGAAPVSEEDKKGISMIHRMATAHGQVSMVVIMVSLDGEWPSNYLM